MAIKIYQYGGLILAEEAGEDTQAFTPSSVDLWSSGNQIGFTDLITKQITNFGEYTNIRKEDDSTPSSVADAIQYLALLFPSIAPTISKSNIVTDSDIGAVDDTWIDQWSEIDCIGYRTIGIWVDMTVNDSTGNQLQVLSLNESGGDEFILGNGTYQQIIGDASVKKYYEFEVDNNIKYIQIQTKATLVGATEATVSIDITKGS